MYIPNLMGWFDDLGAIPNVTSAAIVSTEGFPIEYLLPEGIDEIRIAARTAALFSLSERAIIQMRNGNFEQLYIIGSEGYLLVMPAGPNMILIASTTKSVDDNDRYPYPYIFKPPEPPGDLGVVTQLQVKKPINKEPDDEYYCQYCGRTLTKEERFSHNCRKSPQ